MLPWHYSFLSIIIFKRIGERLLPEVISRLAAVVQLCTPRAQCKKGRKCGSALLVLEHNSIKMIGVYNRGNKVGNRRRLLCSLWGAPGGGSYRHYSFLSIIIL